MGQKVNPIVFRKVVSNPFFSDWFSKTAFSSHLLSQEMEIKKFLIFLLRSKGIVLRSCTVLRRDNCLFLSLDIFFSRIWSRQAKFSWLKNFYKVMKRKYTMIRGIKNLRSYIDIFRKQDAFSKYKMENPLLKEIITADKVVTETKTIHKETKEGVNTRKEKRKTLSRIYHPNMFSLDYRKCLRFFVLFKEKKRYVLQKKPKMAFYCGFKRSFLPKVVRLKLLKISKLFVLRKIKFDFQKFLMSKQMVKIKRSNYDLLELNKSIATTLQNFCGLEKISVKLYSSQLNFLPSLKLYFRFLVKELFIFFKNKHTKNHFCESLEVFYFVLGTFSFGNAALLVNLISYLIEKNRRHLLVVRFIKKLLATFFKKLPPTFLSVDGVKILIKGRFNKRRRTKTIVMQEGEISLQTFENCLDYCQGKAITIYGSFGIRVWLLKKGNN